jgi:hypothetical protein
MTWTRKQKKIKRYPAWATPGRPKVDDRDLIFVDLRECEHRGHRGEKQGEKRTYDLLELGERSDWSDGHCSVGC